MPYQTVSSQYKLDKNPQPEVLPSSLPEDNWLVDDSDDELPHQWGMDNKLLQQGEWQAVVHEQPLIRAPREAPRLPKWFLRTKEQSHLSDDLEGRTRAQSRAAEQANVVSVVLTSAMDLEELVSHNQAMQSPEWMRAMKRELDSLYRTDTWDLCDLPSGKKAIGSRWGYKVKCKYRWYNGQV